MGKFKSYVLVRPDRNEGLKADRHDQAKENASSLGADPEKIVVIGSSAGAGLVSNRKNYFNLFSHQLRRFINTYFPDGGFAHHGSRRGGDWHRRPDPVLPLRLPS